MNVFCIAISSDASDINQIIESSFPGRTYEVSARTWIVASKKSSCSDISSLVGLIPEDNTGIGENTGLSGNTGIVVRVDEYYGFDSRALWEKINEWRDQ